MFKKLRVRTFAKFISQHGAEKLMDALEKNERDGMIYHYEGKLTGDYDTPESEEGIILLINRGL